MLCTLNKQNHLRFISIIISFIIFNLAYAQNAEFKAVFKSLENGEPVLYAKISSPRGEAKLTNVNGFVAIDYKMGDMLTISHLTYDTLFVNTASWKGRDSLVFYLQPKVYDLREVRFTILGDRSLFDNKFVSNNLGKSDEEKVREKLKILEMRQELIGLDKMAQDGMVLGSPITYMYDRFSKNGKERRKYAELLERDRQLRASGKKFDDLIIVTLTNYENEELVKFKEFCSFHPSYIEAVDALELYFEILRCRKEYIQKEYSKQ